MKAHTLNLFDRGEDLPLFTGQAPTHQPATPDRDSARHRLARHLFYQCTQEEMAAYLPLPTYQMGDTVCIINGISLAELVDLVAAHYSEAEAAAIISPVLL